jgi:3-oxoacyl-[acyl-carrier-protein] synthase III
MTIETAITATGRCLASRTVPNSYFYDELGLETTEEWIQSRTGIVERRVVDREAGETTSTMSTEAARRCLDAAQLKPEDIDGILVATSTGDLIFPPTACLVQHQLGAKNAWAWDCGAACSGYVFALAQADGLIKAGRARRVLVIGADTMSAILDYTDRNSAIIFGDGAGCTLLEAVETPRGGRLVDLCMHADGSGMPMLYQPAGGSAKPPTHETIDAREHYLKQDGRRVFKHAVTRITEVIRELLDKQGLSVDDVDLVVPHQANIRIIEACWKRLGIPKERVMVSVERWANTTAGTIPTTLDLAVEQGRISEGSTVVLATFGAGFTWGSALLQY